MKSRHFWIFFVSALIIYGIGEFLIATGRIDPFYENLLITLAINIILAVSLHLIIGITGQLSIGHAGFLAIGAYFSAILTMIRCSLSCSTHFRWYHCRNRWFCRRYAFIKVTRRLLSYCYSRIC